MKRLHFTRRRVAFRVALCARPGIAEFASGVVEGHFVIMERSYWTGAPRWQRYFEVRPLSAPSSLRSALVRVPAEHVFRFPVVS